MLQLSSLLKGSNAKIFTTRVQIFAHKHKEDRTHTHSHTLRQKQNKTISLTVP